jgi:hypothetical protein
MVEILSKPLNHIVIHQTVKYDSAETLARSVVVQSSAGQPVSLSWIGGIVFKIVSPPFVISDLLAKEYLEGRLHVSILYSAMPVFKSSIHVAEENISLPVLNESNNAEAQTIVSWLKTG